MNYRILAVDDDQLFLGTLQQQLKCRPQLKLETANSGTDAIAKIKADPFSYAIVLLDFDMPYRSGEKTVLDLLSINPKLLVSMYSGSDVKDKIIESMRNGAIDFFLKGDEFEAILHKIDGLCAKFDETCRILQEAPKNSSEEKINAIGMIGRSVQLAEVAKNVQVAAKESCGVLIQGETGTGKELVAKAIHSLSDRRTRNFVGININALSENLLESELFGHIKGSFTGAVENKVGKFKLADGGTLFLDEIGDMRIDLQVKLLRLLQEGEFYPVGSNKLEKANVRIIAATHVDLAEAVRQGKFRQDLYYRLNVLNLKIPPLRDRPEDIRPLVLHFQKKYRAKDKVFLLRTIKRMEKYYWPGNIRELENDVQRLALISESAIGEIHLDSKFYQGENIAVKDGAVNCFGDVDALKERMEIDLITKTFSKFKKLTDAAAFLKVPISTLHKKMKRHNLKLEDFV